ncbi:hypothetical protein EDD15DRAFT_222502 [Pisolithus albus]|nr:hypothetical protein EDD15DRAFT_222502 [Pisolithus albus]
MGFHAALRFLHSVDWVHRVIGGGNALRSSEMSKLADPEYAKHMESNTTDEVRTGTLDFMACEVQAQAYLFALLAGNPVGDDDECPFRFNPLHDMESLWWIATWTLYYHVDQKGGRPSSQQITEFYELFPGRPGRRTNAILARLDYKVLPASFQSAGRLVEYMRREIKRAYTASEEELPPVYSNPLKRLQSTFTNHLTSIVADSTDIRIFSLNTKRQQEYPMSDTRDTKQPEV